MKNEYALSVEKFHGEWFWFLRKGETLIDFISCEEGKKHKAIGVYLLKKNNIPFEAAGYSHGLL